MISNMGDGDLVDPALQGIDASEEVAPEPEDDAVEEGPDDADAPERASEVDDITDSLPRSEGAGEALGEGDAQDGAGGDVARAAAETDVEVDIEALLAEREEYRALAQRLQADFENFRRRSSAQAKAEAERASGRLAEALLPVLDAAEAAYVRHPDEVGPLLNQMLTELKRHGLEALDLDGAPFDPEVAEAVAHEPSAGGEPIVAEVLRSGYRWKGRTLRPAMVKTTD